MREFNYQNIVGSVVRNIPSRCAENPYFIGHSVWFAVAEICGLGSNAACDLCIENGVDPHAKIGES